MLNSRPSLQKNLLILSAFALVTLSVSLITMDEVKYKNNQNNCMPQVSVIDSKKLKNTALCFKTHDVLSKKLESIMNTMQTEENSIKTDYNKIQLNKELSSAKKKKNLELLDDKWSEISQKYKKQLQSIRETEIKISEIIQNKLNEAIKYVANDKKIDIILNTESQNSICVFFFEKNTDVTELVVQRLNKILPTISLEKILK